MKRCKTKGAYRLDLGIGTGVMKRSVDGTADKLAVHAHSNVFLYDRTFRLEWTLILYHMFF